MDRNQLFKAAVEAQAMPKAKLLGKFEHPPGQRDPLERMAYVIKSAKEKKLPILCILCCGTVFGQIMQRFKGKIGYDQYDRFLLDDVWVLWDRRGILKNEDFNLICGVPKNAQRLITAN